MRRVERNPAWSGCRRDERLISARAIEPGTPDRGAAPVVEVRPVDVRGGDSHTTRSLCTADQALIHTGAVEIRASDGGPMEAEPGSSVRPVDVRAVDRDPTRAGAA